MQPYYDTEGITIYHADCRDVLPTLERPSVIIADPPYGVASRRGDGKIRRPVAGDDVTFDPQHLLDLDVPTVLFGANNFASLLPDTRGWLIWDKTFPECAEQSQAELAWTNFVAGIRTHREAYHGFMRKRDGWLHPTQKPVGLFRWILGLRWTPQRDPVVDPYMGSGPVLVAAKSMGFRGIGIEIEERYCEIAANRLRQMVLPLDVTA
jgi:site-specific DNA-methyltransferase (adenine-specific)